MRIVGGRFKGRGLTSPSSAVVRPTSDRLRESIFNILAHAYDDVLEGARVLDLFAGTGALGLEALSRGGVYGLFVDDSSEGRALLRANIETLGLAGVTRIFRSDATKLGPMPPQAPFTLAFIDPPYGRDLAGRALTGLHKGGWLSEGAVCVVEEEAQADVLLPEGFAQLDRRVTGDTQMLILRHTNAQT
ncbi:MAG: methyltransferase [Hyphomicrobiales bacterium]|nr:methyltransferase [Hyphomicrobiales bacterium]